jgi:hypothetical protein
MDKEGGSIPSNHMYSEGSLELLALNANQEVISFHAWSRSGARKPEYAAKSEHLQSPSIILKWLETVNSKCNIKES